MSVLDDKIDSSVSGHYWCDRVWEGWQVGTMTEEDFTPSEETELVSDIKALILSEVEAFAERVKAKRRTDDACVNLEYIDAELATMREGNR